MPVFVALKPVEGDHAYVDAPVAVKLALEPLQIVASTPALTVGRAFTPIVVTADVAEQPLAFVTVTLYDVALVGDTVIDAVVSPVLHK